MTAVVMLAKEWFAIINSINEKDKSGIQYYGDHCNREKHL
jgi:hypothetical protein